MSCKPLKVANFRQHPSCAAEESGQPPGHVRRQKEKGQHCSVAFRVEWWTSGSPCPRDAVWDTWIAFCAHRHTPCLEPAIAQQQEGVWSRSKSLPWCYTSTIPSWLSMRMAPAQLPAENVSARLRILFNLPSWCFTISVGMSGYRPVWFNFLCRCRAFPGLNTLVYNAFYSCSSTKICQTLHHKQIFIEVENVIIWYMAKLIEEFQLSISIWLLFHFRWLCVTEWTKDRADQTKH